MSRFRSVPRKGHLERLQRIYGYVLKTKHYSTRYRTVEPDCSYLPNMKYDWSYTVYDNVQEIIPNNCPKPLGKSVTTTTTLDANLLKCLATGFSLTACLHFCNQTPTDWYSKKQAAVETATYGSEFVAAKTATEPKGPHQVKIIYVWQQQICCSKCHRSSLNLEQEAQYPCIP